MSTVLAIASVTQVLKDLLNDGLIDHDITGITGGNVTVTALSPDKIDTTPDNEPSQLNLFMYQATPNLGWSNRGLPSRNGRGERISNPPLALDLHYLLTAYGANELHTEILLGYGMQLFHENPVLVRDAIRRALAPPSPVGGGLPSNLQALSTSELADQVEQIKITPEILNTEELSKLWAAFQAKYRPTAAYKATVVIIESRRSTKPALPVRDRNIYVIPFQEARIEKIKSQSAPGAPIVENHKILMGYKLVIEGNQLKSDVVKVNISGVEITPAAEDISSTRIILPLPSDLSAGIQSVQVIHQTLMGSPPEPHRGIESNVAAFVLSPDIQSFNVTNVQGTGTALRSADIRLTVTPEVGESQRVILLLNEFITGATTALPHSYSFHAPPMTLLSPPAPTGDITIPISGVKAGRYLLRIQVDGAESPLETDAVGRFHAPQITIP